MRAAWTIKKMEERNIKGIFKEVPKGRLLLDMSESDLVDLKNKLSKVLFDEGYYLE